MFPVNQNSIKKEFETTISVNELNTVEPGPQKIYTHYTDVEGRVVHEATVTATGDSACLPVTMSCRKRSP